jgi:transposase
MIDQRYSRQFKEAAVKKFLNRGTRQVLDVVEEIGISAPTLYAWRKELATGVDVGKSKRPQDRSAEEKLKAVLMYESLSEEKRGEFLRKEGLHAENIEQWREQIKAALSPAKQTQAERSERAEDRRKIKELEKELRRKDKALAETTALLVLKKKASLIWGTGEDE